MALLEVVNRAKAEIAVDSVVGSISTFSRLSRLYVEGDGIDCERTLNKLRCTKFVGYKVL
jgi:hypothetical protein